MVDHDQEPSTPEATPLRFGEILAASTMMTEVAGLPLECWPGYRYSAVRADQPRSKSSGFSGRSLMRAWLRFAKATVVAAVKLRRSVLKNEISR
jgi:hypothetical protein